MSQIGNYSLYLMPKSFHTPFGQKTEYDYIVRKCVGEKHCYDGGLIWEDVAKFDNEKDAEEYISAHETKKADGILTPVVEGYIIDKKGKQEDYNPF